MFISSDYDNLIRDRQRHTMRIGAPFPPASTSGLGSPSSGRFTASAVPLFFSSPWDNTGNLGRFALIALRTIPPPTTVFPYPAYCLPHRPKNHFTMNMRYPIPLNTIFRLRMYDDVVHTSISAPPAQIIGIEFLSSGTHHRNAGKMVSCVSSLFGTRKFNFCLSVSAQD